MTPYYDEGGVTIYHGDCREILPQLSADAIFTDPPYGIGIKYGKGSDDSRSDYWPWMREMVEIMRACASMVVFTHRVKALSEITDWDWIGVWRKRFSAGSRLGNSMVLPHWEPIFMYGIHQAGTTSSYTDDVWEYNPERSGVTRNAGFGREGWAKNEGADHPAPKPLGLYRDLIESLGQNATTVLDPFMGSGTTLRAAKDLGRHAIGIEIEERFCELAAERMGQEVLDFGTAA